MPPVGFIWDDPPPPPPPARTPAPAAAWTAAEAEALKARVEALEDRAAWTAAEAEALEARVEALMIECGMESVKDDTWSYTAAEWDEWRKSFWR